MKKTIILLIVFMLLCSCTVRNEKDNPVEESTKPTAEDIQSPTVSPTPSIPDPSPEPETTATEIPDSMDEETQFIIVTYDESDPSDKKNYLHLCDLNGSCSELFKTGDTISSVSDTRFNKNKSLIVAIYNGTTINLKAIKLDNPNEPIDIAGSGNAYLQDFNASTLLILNQQSDEPSSTRVLTFNLEDKQQKDLSIACEVHSARFGLSTDEIYFNGICDSVKALYLFNGATNKISTILDLPVDEFSISPNKAMIAYNHFTDLAQLEIFYFEASSKVSDEKLKLASSFFTMWLDSDRLLFSRKIKGNEVAFFIWNLADHTIAEADLPAGTIAFSKGLDFSVNVLDSKGINLVNNQTRSVKTINLPANQTANMVYFLGIDK